MDIRIRFKNWLINHERKSEKTANNYMHSINVINNELHLYGMESGRILKTSSLKEFENIIELLMFNGSFLKRNSKGNRMYSSALKCFKRYLEFVEENKRLESEENTRITENVVEYHRFINENVKTLLLGNNTSVDSPSARPDYRIGVSSQLWKRDPKIAIGSIRAAGYLCEINPKHKDFISKYSGENYVEAHHLIPMSFQKDFIFSLDVPANIVSLCTVCHKKIHLGRFEDKVKTLEKLFYKREKRLELSGLDISLEELLLKYEN